MFNVYVQFSSAAYQHSF